MRAEVEQGVVGDGVGAPAAAPVGDLGDHRDLGPGGRGRAQRGDGGVEAPVEGDVGRGLQGGERCGPGPVRGGRLLDQHRESGGRADAGVGEVRGGRGGEDEGVDVGAGEQRCGVGEGGQAVGEGGDAVAAHRVRLGDGGEHHVAGGGRGGQVADLGKPAGPDEPDPDGAGHEALRSWTTAGAPTVVIATSGTGGAAMIVGSGAGAAPVRLSHPTC